MRAKKGSPMLFYKTTPEKLNAFNFFVKTFKASCFRMDMNLFYVYKPKDFF